MSKTKHKTKSVPPALTTAHVDEIAKAIHGTTANVYLVAERICGFKPDSDELFRRLKDEQELFRCMECNEWFDASCLSPNLLDACCGCEDESNAADADGGDDA